MSLYCNYDSNPNFDGQLIKENSDCYENCINLDGCDSNNLGNGICESSCNTENCGLDWGDCTCSPGCLDSMLGDGNCDEVCDNWDCDLDNHDCGQCASGCFTTMLGNGICDYECNNEDCLYDYKDCQCSENCLWTDYGTCKPECMVLECNYDKLTQYANNWCQNISLAIFSSYQQIIRKNFSYIVHLEDCYEASNHECTLEKALNFSICYQECNITECNFANGNCFYNPTPLLCGRYYDFSYNFCLSCLNYTFNVWSDGDCIQSTDSSLTLPDGSSAIIPIKDSSSPSNPHIYFVRSDINSNITAGDGTYFSPYTNFINALYHIQHRYSTVILLEGDNYYLTVYNTPTVFLSPIVFLRGLADKYIKVTTLNHSIANFRRVKDDDSNGSHDTFNFDLQNIPSFEINNVVFNWEDTISDCSNSSYCDYCPYVVYDSNSSSYYNDRGEPITEFLPYSWCKQDRRTNFFSLTETNLMLKNVFFINFRNGFNSLVSINGWSNVTLFNVTFDNIRIYNEDSSSGIIFRDDILHNSGNLEFTNGVVSRVNNGYELWDIINTRGFLYATSINSVVFRNVDFSNNVVFKQTLPGINEAALITLNMFQALRIDKCNFTYNYCDLGILNIKGDYLNFSAEINDNSTVIYSTINNIYISNSRFVSNYGKQGGILYALYSSEVQNLLIENCLFSLNGVEEQPLIYFEGPSVSENYVSDSEVNLVLPNGSIAKGKYLAKWWKLYNSSFIENYSGSSGMIEINNMVNINWKYINITRNGEISTEIMNINSIFTKYYTDNPKVYAKLNVSDPPDLNCESLSALSNSINLNLEQVNITNNICKFSSPNIIISNTTNISINYSHFANNYGTGADGVCLSLDDKSAAIIGYSEFISNKNYDSRRSGTISSYCKLSLENCTFYNNTGALYFEGQSLEIISSIFDSNNSTGSHGGSIYFSISSYDINFSLLSVYNSTFENNFCSVYGGAIFIDKKTPLKNILTMRIENSSFYKNKAIDGSCFYIDENVELSTDSAAINCKFHGNNAISSGAILLAYTHGVILFEKCSFVGSIGAYSSVFDISIGEDEKLSPSKIILNLCIFQWNYGENTISLGNSKRNSTLETNDCNFEYNTGLIFSFDSGYAFDKNSKIRHNYSKLSGGSLNLKNSAVFLSVNATHFNCTSNLNGGAVSISLGSQYFCSFCIFENNHADFSGGAIYADSDASFYIEQSVLNGNSCKTKGSAISISSSSANSTITKSEIYGNYAYNDGTIFVLSSILSIFSSKIHNNSAGGINPGLYADDSTIAISDADFAFQNGDQGCFIFMNACSAKINGTVFSGGYSISSGTAIHSTSSEMEIGFSTFSGLSSNETGGAIYFYEGSSLYIKNSKFLNLNSSIDSYLSSISITDTVFSSSSSVAILGIKITELLISFSEFLNNLGSDGGAIYCSQCNKILIAESLFEDNFAEKGGAIFIENQADNPTICSIILCTFQSNNASSGGAIFANNINLNVSFSNFIENYAKSSRAESLLNIVDGIGGAIKIDYEDYKASNYFNISGNRFSYNRATYRGGAISWDNSNSILENNIFHNNSAFYGDDFASYPTMIIYLNQSNSRYLKSQVLSTNVENLALSNVASGQNNNPSLIFAIVDEFYQIITTDIYSQAQLMASDNDTVISGVSVAYALNGIYYFENYVISAKPGSSVQAYISSSAIDTKAEKLKNSQNFYINASMRLCEIGEAVVGLNCEVCPEFYYNIDSSSGKCSNCPSSAVCYGNYTIVPKPGYWRDNNLTDIFWKCPYPPSCLGSPDSNNISFVGICEKGYESNMCNSCQKGYARLYSNQCQKCPDTTGNIFRWLGFFWLFCFIVMIINKVGKILIEPWVFLQIYIKIFWDYLQFTIIIATFNLNWPYKITWLFYIDNCVDYINAQLFSFDCFLQSSYSKSEIYFYKILFTSLTPFYIAIIFLFWWIIVYKVKRKRLKDLKDGYIPSLIIIYFLIYPSVAKSMLNTMSCKEINLGEFWLNEDLGIRCWDQRHFQLAFLLALPALIIWVIAVPGFCLCFFKKNKKKLTETWMKLRFGFLCNGYKSKFYYWEFLMLYCKTILILCSVFLPYISQNIQVLITFLLLALLFHIHNKNKPFILQNLNQSESFAISISLLTILAGFLFIANALNEELLTFSVLFLLIIHCLFILYIALKSLSLIQALSSLIIIIKRSLRLKSKYSIEENSKNDHEEMVRDYKILPLQDEKLSTTIVPFDYIKTFQNISSMENVSLSVELDPFTSEKSLPADN
ncbi:unnamed protein product [Blepharisma stoltei]|uniref:LNR domain-containing protein n=1 Tax=Blepharisma stoltei TaxID=1481888 RepID=A0AAU9IBG1_9CILI|nr:unnamed protein product [Blepharisma stoltei]